MTASSGRLLVRWLRVRRRNILSSCTCRERQRKPLPRANSFGLRIVSERVGGRGISMGPATSKGGERPMAQARWAIIVPGVGARNQQQQKPRYGQRHGTTGNDHRDSAGCALQKFSCVACTLSICWPVELVVGSLWEAVPTDT